MFGVDPEVFLKALTKPRVKVRDFPSVSLLTDCNTTLAGRNRVGVQGPEHGAGQLGRRSHGQGELTDLWRLVEFAKRRNFAGSVLARVQLARRHVQQDARPAGHLS